MILVVDIGNTQVKWAVTSLDGWLVQAQCPITAIEKLSLYWSDLPVPSAIVVSNVASSTATSAVNLAASQWDVNPHWIEAKREQCGVTNSYASPEQLGADRWAAVIGAKSLNLGNVVAVCAGTATTVHGLTQAGIFLGGLIIPGYDLLHQSLGANAFRLLDAEGQLSTFPISTADAITTGAIKTTCATIESFCEDMEKAGHHNVQIVLAGGAAKKIRREFTRSILHKEDLILLGLLEIAKSL